MMDEATLGDIYDVLVRFIDIGSSLGSSLGRLADAAERSAAASELLNDQYAGQTATETEDHDHYIGTDGVCDQPGCGFSPFLGADDAAATALTFAPGEPVIVPTAKRKVHHIDCWASEGCTC